MESSPTAIALVSVAAIAGMFGFVLSIVNQKRVRHTSEWLRDERPEEWESVALWLRTVHPLAAIRRLNKVIKDDPEFTMHYNVVHRTRPPMLAALGVAIASIVIVLVGTFAGWWTL